MLWGSVIAMETENVEQMYLVFMTVTSWCIISECKIAREKCLPVRSNKMLTS